MSVAAADDIAYASGRGRWVLAATVIGSGMASLDATVVNIALPAIGREVGGAFSTLQWVVTAYALTLAALLLLGGALSDRYGRRRVFLAGVLWFTVASVGCGLARTAEMLVIARALQGVGAALLTPGSLAILEASFRERDRAAAVGAWSGLGGLATAIGPLVGGVLIRDVSWRAIFLINVPLAAAAFLIARRHVPETRDPAAPRRLDLLGAGLAMSGLGGSTWAIIEAPARGATRAVVAAGVASGLALIAFFVLERRRDAPMLDLSLFRSRQFSAANAETFLVYAALGGAFFLLPMELQLRLGYSPLGAGLALLPVTLLMLLLSARMGWLAQRIGPRLPMSVGPGICAVALVLLSRLGGDGRQLERLLPAVAVFGLGLATTVAPLTATVLAAAPSGRAGIASAINNCVARTGGLLSVALLPALAGPSRGTVAGQTAGQMEIDFGRGLLIAAILCAAGGCVGWFGIRNPRRKLVAPARSCPLDATPLGTDEPSVS